MNVIKLTSEIVNADLETAVGEEAINGFLILKWKIGFMEFIEETLMPHSIKCFSEIAEDYIDFLIFCAFYNGNILGKGGNCSLSATLFAKAVLMGVVKI